MSTLAEVALEKQSHPERFCPFPRCLSRTANGIGGCPRLMDGGLVTAPCFGLYNPDTGEFDVENKGVSPDVEVELDPALWRQGHDPQLEKGVSVALQELKDHPVPPIKRPKYPVYNWQKVRAEAAKGQTTSARGSSPNH